MVGQARKLLPRVAHDLHYEAVQREVPGPEGMPTIVIVALLLHTCRCTFPATLPLACMPCHPRRAKAVTLRTFLAVLFPTMLPLPVLCTLIASR